MPKKSTYLSLADRCKKIGFDSYDEYLASGRWAIKRKRFLELYGTRRCWACGSKPRYLHVHHKTYARLGRERMDDFVPLCEPCHKELHAGIKDIGWQLARAHFTLRNMKIKEGLFEGKKITLPVVPKAKGQKSPKPKKKKMSTKGGSVTVKYVEPWSLKPRKR